jgi:hypothetical protein
MERNEERPDIRFWTGYDHFMVEREARALRRRELCALSAGLWRKARTRFAATLKTAGAQPVKLQERAA